LCFASLYTDRAILYRKNNNFSNTSVYISVIIQEMIFSEVSGVMFTADPVS
jgi:pyruvate,water dikinase